ncbi:MAG: ribosome silencing factor [Bacteroidota bacterium]
MAKKKAKSVKAVKPARPAGGKAIAKKLPKKAKKAPVKKIIVKKTESKKPVKNKKVSAKPSKSLGKVIAKPARPAGGKVAQPTVKKVKNKVQLLADAAVEGILELKGKNITIMNLEKIHNRVCDYYIICQADSNTQVNAIAASVEEMVKKKTGERPYRSEGFQNSEWILVDYVTVVVHIFQSHIRNFYNLESLWADAEITELAFD